VLEHVVAGLECERDVPELASLCRLVVDHAHGLTVTAVMAGGDRRTVDVERGVAQRLSAADAP
jgi:hypothetical protein